MENHAPAVGGISTLKGRLAISAATCGGKHAQSLTPSNKQFHAEVPDTGGGMYYRTISKRDLSYNH